MHHKNVISPWPSYVVHIVKTPRSCVWSHVHIGLRQNFMEKEVWFQRIVRSNRCVVLQPRRFNLLRRPVQVSQQSAEKPRRRSRSRYCTSPFLRLVEIKNLYFHSSSVDIWNGRCYDDHVDHPNGAPPDYEGNGCSALHPGHPQGGELGPAVRWVRPRSL